MADSTIPQDGTLDKGRRRSMRVMLSVIVVVSAKDREGKTLFEEETNTLVVNAHGALIHLHSEVAANQKIIVTNKATRAVETCRVVYVGAMQEAKAPVGIEFDKPSPKFWAISFPPDDWNLLPE